MAIFGIEGSLMPGELYSPIPVSCSIILYLSFLTGFCVDLPWLPTFQHLQNLHLSRWSCTKTGHGLQFKSKSGFNVPLKKPQAYHNQNWVQRGAFRELAIRQQENIQCMLGEIHSKMWHPRTIEKRASISCPPWVTEPISYSLPSQQGTSELDDCSLGSIKSLVSI